MKENNSTDSDNDTEVTEKSEWSQRLVRGATVWLTRLGVSGLCGYCSGYFVKKTLKKIAYYIGGFFIVL